MMWGVRNQLESRILPWKSFVKSRNPEISDDILKSLKSEIQNIVADLRIHSISELFLNCCHVCPSLPQHACTHCCIIPSIVTTNSLAMYIMQSHSKQYLFHTYTAILAPSTICDHTHSMPSYTIWHSHVSQVWNYVTWQIVYTSSMLASTNKFRAGTSHQLVLRTSLRVHAHVRVVQ